MRDTVKTVVSFLKCIFVFGFILILIGFLYFMEIFTHDDLSGKYGAKILDNSLFGITYQTLFMFGFSFVIIS